MEIINRDNAIVTYTPRFITRQQAKELFNELIKQPDWTHDQVNTPVGIVLSPRKIMALGDEGLIYEYNGATRDALPYTPILKTIRDELVTRTGEDFNFVLANLYQSGEDHIGWHSDKEEILVHGASIASISLGAEREFLLRHRGDYKKAQELPANLRVKAIREARTSIKLQNGSLLMMKGSTQYVYQHSLPKRKNISEPRINLTFRKIKPITS